MHFLLPQFRPNCCQSLVFESFPSLDSYCGHPRVSSAPAHTWVGRAPPRCFGIWDSFALLAKEHGLLLELLVKRLAQSGSPIVVKRRRSPASKTLSLLPSSEPQHPSQAPLGIPKPHPWQRHSDVRAPEAAIGPRRGPGRRVARGLYQVQPCGNPVDTSGQGSVHLFLPSP